MIIPVSSPQEFAQQISSGLVVVYTTATKCSSCKTADVWLGAIAAANAADGVRFISVNIDDDWAQPLLQIQTMPTFLAFANGREVGPRLAGALRVLVEGFVTKLKSGRLTVMEDSSVTGSAPPDQSADAAAAGDGAAAGDAAANNVQQQEEHAEQQQQPEE